MCKRVAKGGFPVNEQLS